MPTYEYRCPNGHEFELFQRISEEPRARCPECGALSERLLSGGAGFLFKGEGFYATDYRSESYKREASKERGEKGADSLATGKKKDAPVEATSSGEAKGTDSPPPPSSGTPKKEES